MKKNTFIEGTVIATLAIVFTKVLGMLYVIPFYSIIGSQGSSLYSYAYNIYLIFLSISSAGIPTAISKITSEYEATGEREAKVRSFKLGVLIVSVISAICFIVLMFFSENIANLIVGSADIANSMEDITLVISVVSFSVLIIPFLSVARGYLQGHKYIKPSSDSQMIEQVVRIIVILVGSFLVIKILNKSVALGVAVAVSGAFFGGLAALMYVFGKIRKHKSELSLDKPLKRDNVSTKEIVKKIISYALPFVIINLTVNIYNTVDMSLIIRTLSRLGYSGADSEYVAGVITTWGYKLNMIINAIATGMTVSLIPNIVSAYTKKDYSEVNNVLNKALQIVIVASVPMALGLSFLSTPVWNVFYGYNELGSSVFRVSVLTALLCNVYLICIQSAQGLNRYKTVYSAVIIGTVLNALMDVPLMMLFNHLGLNAYYGATVSTLLGYVVSISIVLISLKQIKGIKYSETWKTILKTCISAICMIIVLSVLNIVYPFGNTSRFASIIQIIVYALVGAIVYLGLMYKMGVLTNLFGDYLSRLRRKNGNKEN